MKSQIFKLKEITDERGALCVADFSDNTLPFEIKRAFWIYDVPHGKQRGEHAHRTCEELLIPIQGSFTAHITWCRFSNFTIDCVCLCLASENYFKEGYINDLSTFLKEVKKA